MEISKSEQKNSRVSRFISGSRLVTGFTLAPTLGALIYYLMLNVPLLYGYKLPDMSLSMSPEFLIGGTLIAGSIFYAPAVFLGFSIMMLIRHYYSWNLICCIIGGMICAVAVASIFLTLVLFAGFNFAVAGVGFLMMLLLIIAPSIFSGVSFWLIAVHKNDSLDDFMKAGKDQITQPAFG